MDHQQQAHFNRQSCLAQSVEVQQFLGGPGLPFAEAWAKLIAQLPEPYPATATQIDTQIA